MAALTANDFAQQMVAQARLLDPSFSGEVGTPERKIIDVVAQALADSQIDLTALQGALDIDAKFGQNLDRFVSLFGMQRQQSTFATGFVTFGRTTPATVDITIPVNTVIQSTTTLATLVASPIQFVTTATGTITAGQTTSNAVPVQAVTAGSIGNLPANSLTVLISNVPSVTSVTNSNAITNGLDPEDDNSLKVRFKNTWARNLAGTEDQYLALALAGTFTTKAVVIGDQSRYQEYIQVPDYDDAGYLNAVQYLGPGTPSGYTGVDQNTFGTQNFWTSGLSTIPYAKQIYTTTPNFVSNGQSGAAQVYYSDTSDFRFNYPPLYVGDTVRDNISTTLSGSQTFPENTVTVQANGALLFQNSGTLSIGGFLVTYTGKTSNTFTGCVTTGTGTVPSGTPVYQVDTSRVTPNFSFINVFNPSGNPSPPAGLQAVSPGDVVLSEFSYVSSASRNDLTRNVNNAVDVYVDGSNDLQTSCILLPNVVLGGQSFNTTPTSPWYYENYRRDGQPAKRPQVGNYITPLFQSPITEIPSSITVNSQTYTLGTHYWLVHEVGQLGGSIRARDGIEWKWDTTNIASVSATTTAPSTGIILEVDNYTYDSNIVTLQGTMSDAAQVTTDVLVHKASNRYFKLDITVMYSSNVSLPATNTVISTSLQAFFDRQYFGTVIQLSDLLEVIHEVSGVDNVRWSNDFLGDTSLVRVLETDALGNPLHNASIDQLRVGTGLVPEQQTLYLVGNPSGQTNGVADYFTMHWVDGTLPGGQMTATIPFWNIATGATVKDSDIQAAIAAVAPGSGKYHSMTVVEDVRPTTGVTTPIRSFTITYGAVGSPVVPTLTSIISRSDYTYDADFFLLDHELPTLPTGMISGDTLPGLIIRTRAQNTFARPGLG